MSLRARLRARPHSSIHPDTCTPNPWPFPLHAPQEYCDRSLAKADANLLLSTSNCPTANCHTGVLPLQPVRCPGGGPTPHPAGSWPGAGHRRGGLVLPPMWSGLPSASRCDEQQACAVQAGALGGLDRASGWQVLHAWPVCTEDNLNLGDSGISLCSLGSRQGSFYQLRW